ncbi:MAG: hypothetical protein LCI00_19305 [Chloroflexi bacterium]|nr:hypothetical protein [Chloroflexota bacterium]MCC6891451.1 hypothetical protein [Anaerolineae bacterium]
MTAIWTTPKSWATSELLTAALLNTHLRDNLDWLKTPPAGIDTAMSIATTSATLVDVTGSAISVTTTGGGLDVFFTGAIYSSGIATLTYALNIDGIIPVTFNLVSPAANTLLNASFAYHIAGVSVGAHTLKMQVSTNAGTVTITGTELYAVERGA